MGKSKNAQEPTEQQPETLTVDDSAATTAAASVSGGDGVLLDLQEKKPEFGSDSFEHSQEDSAPMEANRAAQGVIDDERSGDQGSLAERIAGTTDGSGSSGTQPFSGRAGIHADGTAATVGENAASVGDGTGSAPAGGASQEDNQLADSNNIDGGTDHQLGDPDVVGANGATHQQDGGSSVDGTGSNVATSDTASDVHGDQPGSGSDRPDPLIDPDPDFIGEELYAYDGRVWTAIDTFSSAFHFASRSELPAFDKLELASLKEGCRFIRKIKKDATAPVLVNYLYLNKLIPGNKPCRVQEVALSCMAHTLLTLDAHHDQVVAENQRKADLDAQPAEIPWAKEDLTLEESDIAPNTF